MVTGCLVAFLGGLGRRRFPQVSREIAIGIAVALREFTIAIGVTVLALIALRGLKIVHVWIDRRRERREP